MVPEESRLPLNREFERGVELFNTQEFYECHEVLEDVWRPAQGATRMFLQALIHFAVGFYHHRQHNQTGAELQLGKAVRKLAGYLPAYQGIDTGRLYREGHTALEKIAGGEIVDDFPRFHPQKKRAPV